MYTRRQWGRTAGNLRTILGSHPIIYKPNKTCLVKWKKQHKRTPDFRSALEVKTNKSNI